MKPQEIRAEMIRRGIGRDAIAKEANCTPPEISMCISGARIYPHIRQVIARHLGKPVDRVFGRHHPKQRRKFRWCKAA